MNFAANKNKLRQPTNYVSIKQEYWWTPFPEQSTVNVDRPDSAFNRVIFYPGNIETDQIIIEWLIVIAIVVGLMWPFYIS